MSNTTTWPTIIEEMLVGRTARCGCGATMPSLQAWKERQFFTYEGPGRPGCDECGFHVECHEMDQPDGLNPGTGRAAHKVGHHFDNTEGREFDTFYDGCRGWD